MQLFIEFSLRHWELGLLFFLILGLLLSLELYTRLTGTPALSSQQAVLLVNREEGLILDIRDESAFAKGHIRGSLNLPCTDLANRYQRIDPHREQPIIITYSLGQSHHKVGRFLRAKGFTKLYHLKGGLASWQSAGLSLTKK